MDSIGGSDVGMQVEDGRTASFPSSNVMGNARSNMTISKPSTSAHPFFSAGWDPFILLNHSENLVSRNEPFASNFHSVGNQVIGGSSSPFAGQPFADSRLAYFGNGNLSEAVVRSFSMSEFIGTSDSGCLPNFGSHMNEGGGSEMNSREDVKSHECRNLEDGAGGDSPTNGRTRKRSPDSRSSYDLSENNRNKLHGNNIGKSLDASDALVEKKQKHERNEGPNIPKRSTRQAKDNLSSEEAPKEYVHVRARRGQATNSHSLAEKIRREKISERMRLLQELVPGCSKITGKAVMLDEIINYVQSLQQQVEFLSMKLATIIPDLCFDAGKPLPMDINSQHTGATAPVLGNPGLGSFEHFSLGMSKGTLPISPRTAQYLSLSQLVPLDNELHSLYHWGFDSNPSDIRKADGEIPSRSPLSSSHISLNKQVCCCQQDFSNQSNELQER